METHEEQDTLFSTVIENTSLQMDVNPLNSNSYFCNWVNHHSLLYTIHMFTLLVIVIAGFVGNGIVLVVAFLSKKFAKTSSNTFLVFLAASDSTFLMVVFFHILETMSCLYFPDTPLVIIDHSKFLCKFITFLYFVPQYYSVMVIYCFTAERFVAVSKPMNARQIYTTKRAKMSCVLILVILAFGVAPYTYVTYDIHEPYGCINTPTVSALRSIHNVSHSLILILPIYSVAVINVSIIDKISQKYPVPQGQERLRRKQIRHITRILILISVSYSSLIFPHTIAVLLIQLGLRNDHMQAVLFFTETLYTCMFAINFYLYSAGCKQYRNEVNECFARIAATIHQYNCARLRSQYE